MFSEKVFPCNAILISFSFLDLGRMIQIKNTLPFPIESTYVSDASKYPKRHGVHNNESTYDTILYLLLELH